MRQNCDRSSGRSRIGTSVLANTLLILIAIVLRDDRGLEQLELITSIVA